jgi:DNA-binding winged helix-turn-helix (wHTH) protein
MTQETEARGFALYIGLDETTAQNNGTSLTDVVNALREKLAELAPGTETYAAVALAPKGAGGKNVDVVRAALQDPKVTKRQIEEDESEHGIVIDVSRRRVLADGNNVGLTFKEFELLTYLVSAEGETISRKQLVELLWDGEGDEAVNERTVDVHIRRLRSKIAGYEDIIRTIRGGGYRFDKHPDVVIEDYQI